MKIFSLLVSVIAFVSTLFFLVTAFPDVTTFNGTIYLLLLVVLLLICITGIIINKPVFAGRRRRHRMSFK